MQSQDRISRLAALSLLLSAIELFIPRFVPFFRIGLANIPLLMALNLNLQSYLQLALLKGIGTSLISGNLFSVFALISISQSLCSALCMKAVKTIFREQISVYGISVAGAAASSITQITLAALYAGHGTLTFLPILLGLSLPSSIITAHLSRKIPEPSYSLIEQESEKPSTSLIVLLVVTGCAMMMTENIILILLSCIAAFTLQKRAGRKILLKPHALMLLFMLLSSVITPHGKVITTIFSLPITDGAIINGLSKGLKLSGGIALSQAFSVFIKPGKGIIGKTVATFTMLLTAYRSSTGSIWQRFLTALETNSPSNPSKTAINVPIFTLYGISAIIIAFCIADCVFF